jgi:drug/metabolite transporter (DMT)-like permease
MMMIRIIRFEDVWSQASIRSAPPNPLAAALSLLAAFCYGSAVVISKFALRTVDARRGAAIAVPVSASTLFIVFLAARGPASFDWRAAGIFAAVGFGYPGLVALLRFYATDRIGPSVTSSVLATTSPLFALVVAALFTDEVVPARAVLASGGVVAGIFLITWTRGETMRWPLWWLGLPLAAAAIAGSAQVGTKAGLQLWPDPLSAALISYVVSTAVIVGALSARPVKPGALSRVGAAWFAVTGVLNSMGVLSMFAALKSGPVALVAPIVAGYPLVTLFLSSAVLPDERLTLRRFAGAVLAVGSIAYLVSA